MLLLSRSSIPSASGGRNSICSLGRPVFLSIPITWSRLLTTRELERDARICSGDRDRGFVQEGGGESASIIKHQLTSKYVINRWDVYATNMYCYMYQEFEGTARLVCLCRISDWSRRDAASLEECACTRP